MNASKFVQRAIVLAMFSAFALTSQIAVAASDSGALTKGSGPICWFWSGSDFGSAALSNGANARVAQLIISALLLV